MSPDDPRPATGAVVVEVPEHDADELAGWLGGDSLGVETLPSAPGRIRLRVYVDAAERPGALARVRERLVGWSGDREVPEPAWEEVADRPWVEEYQLRLRPFPLGAGFVVAPGAEPPPSGDRRAIRLVPGRAFGTGEHATTRLCVEELESRVEPGDRWLDLGTGSGILALVAALLGAARVDAVDSDPEAIEVAREVLAANPGAGAVELAVGSADSLTPGRCDGVVANIDSGYFLERARQVARALRPGGLLIASGYLIDDRESVEAALREAGFDRLTERREGEWLAGTFRRGAAP
jgi:ribosomal protein L11 methyltransferase